MSTRQWRLPCGNFAARGRGVLPSVAVSTDIARETAQFDALIPAAEEMAETPPHLGWRILITLILLLLVALLSLLLQPSRVAHSAPAQQGVSDRLVLAFYYTWFDEASWSPDRLSDQPLEAYASRDRGVMGRHIDQAKAAGIDAFVVAWYGPNGDTNQTEPNLAALLDEAAARGFKIAVLFETDSPFLGSVDATTGALQHLLGVHASHPAYLRVDGRPVVFFWRPSIYGVDTWAAIRAQADPGYNAFWVSEGVDTGLLSVFDGHHLYSNTWNPPADLTATNQKFAARVDAMSAATGANKQWVATVMPGYNDVKIRPDSGFATDREGGAYYERAWQAAIAGGADWVVINSFNEWPEGSYIEPSAAYGDRFLGLTATWSGQFKGGTSAPAPVASAAETLPQPEEATAYVRTPILNLRAGPGIDYGLLGQVFDGDALPIRGRNADSTWWQVQAAGAEAWVFGELIAAAGPLDGVGVVDALPAAIVVEPEAHAAEADSVADAEASPVAETDGVSVNPAGFTLTIGDQIYTVRPVRSAE